MRDLEIRGAGSLLGGEQHGNISAVGFDLFAQMLMEAVSEARGEPEVAHPEIRVDLPVPAFMPEEYVPDVDERVRYYRRLAGAPTIEGVEVVASELAEKYGMPPEATRNLIDIARIKSRAADLGITSISLSRHRLMVSPVRLDDEQKGQLASLGTIYLERKKELSFPVGYGESVTGATLGLLSAIYSRQS
jgi:transcription-repair coupling factor (superfamily II helicase)